MKKEEQLQKKILLFSRTDDVFTQQLAENFVSRGIIVHCCDIHNYLFYNYITTEKKIYFSLPSFMKRILPVVFFTRLYTFFLVKRDITIYYDYCHILYNKYEYILLLRSISKMSSKLISSVYGSDLHSNYFLFFYKNYYKRFDIITFTSPELRKIFLNYFKYIDIDKVKVCPWGLKILDLIDEVKTSDNIYKIKTKYGIDRNSIVITVGSYGGYVHQHFKIIKLLSEIELKKFQIFFLFPITYGGNKKYINNLHSSINKFLKNYNYKIIDYFLSYEEVAELRCITDIFINMVLFDQLSGAMIEHLYSGNIVITGKWLPYQVLDDSGVYYKRIDNIQKLNDVLMHCLNNFSVEKSLSEGNKDIIGNIYKWEKTIFFWLKNYTEFKHN
ncbi:MAG: hypothetical protein KA792_00815 [Bacteroidales bacterium]|nr:hypothetical protein [Bacteroidales bacterium]